MSPYYTILTSQNDPKRFGVTNRLPMTGFYIMESTNEWFLYSPSCVSNFFIKMFVLVCFCRSCFHDRAIKNHFSLYFNRYVCIRKFYYIQLQKFSLFCFGGS